MAARHGQVGCADIDEPADHVTANAGRKRPLMTQLDPTDRVAVLVDGFGIGERANQLERRRRVLWLAAGKDQQKREKEDAATHVRAPTNY